MSPDPSLPDFTPSTEAVHSNGQIKLYLRDSYPRGLELTDWSGGTFSDDGDVLAIEAGLTGQDGTQFTLLPDGSNTSFGTCNKQTSWTTAINWTQLHRGSFACVRVGGYLRGRRGILRIDAMPDLSENAPFTILTGSVWEPIVER